MKFIIALLLFVAGAVATNQSEHKKSWKSIQVSVIIDVNKVRIDKEFIIF